MPCPLHKKLRKCHRSTLHLEWSMNRWEEFPCLKIKLKTVDTRVTLMVNTLLDSRAMGLYVDLEFICENFLNTQKLKCAIPVYNVDGTLNEGGAIKETIDFIM